MNGKSHTIAFIGIMSALVFVVLFMETYVFVVLIPLAPPCFLSLSVAITLCLFDDWKKMFLGGTIFGCCSLIIAAFIANPVFILPWISVLPRVFIGITAYGTMALIKKITKHSEKKFLREYLPYGAGAAIGVITNTVLVLSVMYAFKFVGMEEIMATFIAINFPVEVVASAVLVPILVNAVKRIKGNRTEN